MSWVGLIVALLRASCSEYAIDVDPFTDEIVSVTCDGVTEPWPGCDVCVTE